MELTWKDIKSLEFILDKMVDEQLIGDAPDSWASDEVYYSEALNRFMTWKNKQK